LLSNQNISHGSGPIYRDMLDEITQETHLEK